MSTLPNRERVPEYHYASEQSKALIDMLEDASLEAKAALDELIAGELDYYRENFSLQEILGMLG